MSTSNITTDTAVWLQSVATINSDNNISSQLGNLELAAGFVLEEGSITVDGKEYYADNFNLPSPQAATDLIAQLVAINHDVYPFVLIKTQTKDMSKLPEDVQLAMRNREATPEETEAARTAYQEAVAALPEIDAVLFRAVAKAN